MLSRYTDSQSVYESASTTRRWVTPGSPEVVGGSDGMTRVSKGFGAENISILRYAEGLQPVWPAPISGIVPEGGLGGGHRLLGGEVGSVTEEPAPEHLGGVC